MYPIDLDDLASNQQGLITRDQALKLFGEHHTRSLLRAKKLVRVFRNVYRATGTPLGDLALIKAAHLCVNNSVVSHRSALFLHGLADAPEFPDVITDPKRSTRATGINVHHGFVPGEHKMKIDGLPVTTIARTIVDVSPHFDEKALGKLIDNLVANGQTSFKAIAKALDDVGSQGRSGAQQLRKLLADRLPLVKGTERQLELRFARLIQSAGLPAPQTQYRVGKYKLDFAWPEFGVAVEMDGYGPHGTSRKKFQEDRVRNNFIVREGWEMYHFTWNMNAQQLLSLLTPRLAS